MDERLELHPELDELRESIALEDDAGRPVVLHVDRPLRPASQRLMDSLGVKVEVRKVTSVVEEQRGTVAFEHRASLASATRRMEAGEEPAVCEKCGAEIDVANPAHAWTCPHRGTAAGPAKSDEPTGDIEITEAEPATSPEYEASAARAAARAEADDFDLEICAWCHCELDVDEPAHRPGCEGVGKPRVAEISPLAIEAMDRQLEALQALDEGTPQREIAARRSRDLKGSQELKDRPAEAIADSTTTSVGGQDAEGAEAAHDSDGRVGGATKTRRPIVRWTHETALEAIRAAAAELGHAPSHLDYLERHDIPMPSGPTAKKLFGSWADMIEAAGFPRPSRGTNYRRTSSEGRQARRDKPQTAAAAPRDLPPGPEIRVDGTDLVYANADVAIAAADEIERNAERVAAGARESGALEAADRLTAEARELAEKVRAAARTAHDSSEPSRAAAAVGAPVVSPPDEEQPPVGSAATADGSGGAGAATPAPNPDMALRIARVLNEVGEELARAIERHAPMHSPHEGHSVIREELERELWKHVCEDTGRSPAARAEAIQTAAMAVRYVIDLCDEVAA